MSTMLVVVVKTSSVSVGICDVTSLVVWSISVEIEDVSSLAGLADVSFTSFNVTDVVVGDPSVLVSTDVVPENQFHRFKLSFVVFGLPNSVLEGVRSKRAFFAI